jgi:hypothetical protein
MRIEAKLKPYERRKRVRFKPSDRLLAFLERCKMSGYAGWKQDDDRSTSCKSARTRFLPETIRHNPPVGICDAMPDAALRRYHVACSGRRLQKLQHETIEFVCMLEEWIMPRLVEHDLARVLDSGVQLVGSRKR